MPKQRKSSVAVGGSASTLSKHEEELNTREKELNTREEELVAREETLRTDRENFDKERSSYNGNDDTTSQNGRDVLCLNIEGTKKVSVLRSTLTCVPGSMIASKFSGRWDDSIEKDNDGAFFIDHDVSQFAPILSHLRNRAVFGNDKTISPPSLTGLGESEKDNFFRLVEYYGLTSSMYPMKLSFTNADDREKGEIVGLRGKAKKGCTSFYLASDGHRAHVKTVEVKIGKNSRLFGIDLHEDNCLTRIGLVINDREKPFFLFKINKQTHRYDFDLGEFADSPKNMVVRAEDYGRRWFINGKRLPTPPAIYSMLETASLSTLASSTPRITTGEGDFEVIDLELREV